MHNSPRWVTKFLIFWGSKGGYVIIFVFLSSFVFTLVFGNYPQWEAAEIKVDLNEYFQPEIPHTKYKSMTNSGKWIKLYFSYSDGTDLSKPPYKRENRIQITQNWKIDVLNLICTHKIFRQELHKGRKIEVDLRDGDSTPASAILTNMVIDNARC